MKRRHPIDEIFRRGLADRSEEPPLHLWADIDRRRSAAHRRGLYWRRRRGVLLTGAAFLLMAFAAAWLLWPASAPQMGYFPVDQMEISQEKDAVADKPVTTAAETIQEKHSATDGRAATAGEARTGQPLVPPDAPDITSRPAAPDPAGRLALATKRDLQKKGAVTPPAATAVPALPQTEPEIDLRGKTPTPSPLVLLENQLPTPEPAALEVDRPFSARLLPNDPKCARFHRIYWRLSVDLLASPDWNHRRLEGRDPEFDSYAGVRRDSETTQLGFSAGVRFSAVSNFGLALRGGLNYTQLNERFEYLNESEERIIITNVYGPDGGITGTDTLVETGTRHKVTHNRYRLVDIPLIIGYERRFKKVGVSLNGGAYLNLLFRQKGDFLSPQDQQPVNFSSQNPNAFPAFRDRLGVSWYGSVGLTYDLAAGLQLLVEPHFRVNPRSFTHTDYPLTQRYVTTGMFVGVRKTL